MYNTVQQFLARDKRGHGIATRNRRRRGRTTPGRGGQGRKKEGERGGRELTSCERCQQQSQQDGERTRLHWIGEQVRPHARTPTHAVAAESKGLGISKLPRGISPPPPPPRRDDHRRYTRARCASRRCGCMPPRRRRRRRTGPALPSSRPFTRQIGSRVRGTHFRTSTSNTPTVSERKTWLTDGGVRDTVMPVQRRESPRMRATRGPLSLSFLFSSHLFLRRLGDAIYRVARVKREVYSFTVLFDNNVLVRPSVHLVR